MPQPRLPPLEAQATLLAISIQQINEIDAADLADEKDLQRLDDLREEAYHQTLRLAALTKKAAPHERARRSSPPHRH